VATIVLQPDIIDGSRLKEENGVVVSIDRVFILSDLPIGIVADEVLKTALDDRSIPLRSATHPIFSNLVVMSRVPKALGPTIVQVTVTYAVPGGGSFDPPFGSQYMNSGGTSVEQTERALHRLNQSKAPNGGGIPQGDAAGDQITVQYTPPGATEAKIQNGEITPFEGRSVMTFGAQITTTAPWLLAESWVNQVNNGPFFYSQAPARTWLVTDMTYELTVRTSSNGFPIYEMSLTLRHNSDTWDPFVIFIDPETGRPPGPELDAAGDPIPDTGLISGVGYKNVKWHDERDFNQLFSGP